MDGLILQFWRHNKMDTQSQTPTRFVFLLHSDGNTYGSAEDKFRKHTIEKREKSK